MCLKHTDLLFAGNLEFREDSNDCFYMTALPALVSPGPFPNAAPLCLFLLLGNFVFAGRAESTNHELSSFGSIYPAGWRDVSEDKELAKDAGWTDASLWSLNTTHKRNIEVCHICKRQCDFTLFLFVKKIMCQALYDLCSRPETSFVSGQLKRLQSLQKYCDDLWTRCAYAASCPPYLITETLESPGLE